MSESLRPTHWDLQFLSDVTTAAGLLAHGKQCKALAKRIGEGAFRMRNELHDQPAAETNAKLLAALVALVNHKDDLMPSRLWDAARDAIARAEVGSA